MPDLGIFDKTNKNENSTENQAVPKSDLENNENQKSIYLKAIPLRDLGDLESIKKEIGNGNIIILRITPLAKKSIEEVKSAVNELFDFTTKIKGDIARLGEERIVICPQEIKIWREKK